ncbi:alpha-amylase family protein [Roseomonas sp. E05]|uniref:alpha-amylase family protein n=1 Tax=Roseomonas sp. E05 TaxID=3046310 RepID=UPI0024BBA66E|nr:alpha-amylase family protein [Roseomonas sp. E05]MDJ0388885.1 alpha-amylase family protein [Roseomonas sp. E05]
MLNLWYKNAVIYCLDVETFIDSNGDGVGDFRGLADRLDHIESLGATCIWLLPFYPTPNRDNGYDVADYYNVDPKLGTLGDFVEFMNAAQDRGLRVILDLVVNHTSIDHPWFQEARRDRNSPRRNWYVWSDTKPENADEGMVFPGVQESTWTYDEMAGAWYMHRFFKYQPDLNITNPEVREEIERIMGFWLQLGVSGFRIDAAPFLIEYRGVQPPPGRQDPHHYLTEMREFLSWRQAEAMILAEANIPDEEIDEYFGDGDRLHMIFDFMLNQNTFLALARQSAAPVAARLAKAVEIPATAQWATFLRNHDEVDLGRLSEAERQEVFAAFGPEPGMQLYGRGIRRRMAAMLGGDQRRLAMAYSLMFSLPGTPVLWYGDEIGMGEDLSLPDRQPVRTPMQWSDEANGGFSEAPPDKVVRPVISGGAFGHEQVNVMQQQQQAGSLLQHMQRLIRTRRACPEIGWGRCEVLPAEPEGILLLRYTWRKNTLVAAHNFTAGTLSTPLPLDKPGSRVVPLLSSAGGETLSGTAIDPRAPLELEPYGFRWFRLDGQRR